jgi:hypothetical protein
MPLNVFLENIELYNQLLIELHFNLKLIAVIEN